jgi:hypothetical protein
MAGAEPVLQPTEGVERTRPVKALGIFIKHAI